MTGTILALASLVLECAGAGAGRAGAIVHDHSAQRYTQFFILSNVTRPLHSLGGASE